MNKLVTSLILSGGALLFNFLFWEENVGLNALIFSTVLACLGIFLHPEFRRSLSGWITFGGVFLTAIGIVLHNSDASRIMHVLSWLVFLGMMNQPQLKALFHAIATGVWNMVRLPVQFINALFMKKDESVTKKPLWRTFKLMLIPFAFFMVFFIIFQFSNPVFAEYTNTVLDAVEDWITYLFEKISFAWILFFFFGFLFTGWVLFNAKIPHFIELEARLSDYIQRKKSGKWMAAVTGRVSHMALKNEYRSALYLIGSINVLLLVVNAIDINWLWFNFHYDASMNLSQFVHEGTYLLIFSILLSMGILFYFFRKNLNFIPHNKRLKQLAYIWIFQNLILVISVGVRNFYYIQYYGLAYKRIGVIIFLMATIVGLVTLYLKIRDKQSTYRLLRTNSWSTYALLIVMSLINWDVIIVKHNVTHTMQENIDVAFLLSLSDKALPILDQHRHKFDLTKDRYSFVRGFYTYEGMLNQRIEEFMDRKRKTSWKSYNYSEEQAFIYFSGSR